MVEQLYRTYALDEKTVDWVDEFADENDVDKSEVVKRAIRVYAMKTMSGDWKDPKFDDQVESRFEKLH